MVPFPAPEGVTVHHGWSLTTVQLQPEVDITLNEVVPAPDATFWLGGVTDNEHDADAWVTVTMTGVTPLTEIVILATRILPVVFCV